MQAFLNSKITSHFIQNFICMLIRLLVQKIKVVSCTFILTTVYCLLTTDSNAQVYPVLVNTNMRGPYSLNLTDYATPAYDRIQANLYLADITKNNYPVKIRLVIRSVTGINISTSPGNEVGPIYLDGGVNQTITGADVYSLFDANRLTFSGISYNQYRANGLPEGNYQFNFEIVDAQFGIVISNVNVGYANAWLILNDPPIINKPANGITLVPTLPQNIFFQWTPRHTGSPNSAFTTEYDVQLVEIYPVGTNANDAMLTAPIIFEKTTLATAYNYSIADPNLIEGKWYAFRVRAHDQNGLDLFKNQGYSEVFSFYYGAECSTPQQLTVEPTSTTEALVSWNQDASLNSVMVEYKMLADRNWNSVESFSNSVQLTGLVPGAQYDVRVLGKCLSNQSAYSSTERLDMLSVSGLGCTTPQYYNIKRLQLLQSNQSINIAWLPVSNVVSYSVYLQGNGINKTYTKRSNDLTRNTTGLDLFSTGSVTDDYFSITDQIPNVPFTCVFEITCADGSVIRSNVISADLNASNVSVSTCNLPQPLEVTAVAQNLTSVKVSWSTSPWFVSYKFYYRLLGSNSVFTEVITNDPFVILNGLDLTQLYEYQVVYTCLNNSTASASYNTFSIVTDPSLFVPSSTGNCFPPVLFSHQLNNTTATIEWESDRDVDYYFLYWKDVSATTWNSVRVNGTTADITNLTVNTRYEYHIRPVCKNSGLFGIASTNGRFFIPIGGAIPSPRNCPPPDLDSPSAISSHEVTVEAEPIASYTNYLIQIRVYDSNNQWLQINTSTARELIDDLDPNTLYEYQIAAFCGTIQSRFSRTDTIRTLMEDEEFVCGASSGYTVITSQTPIASLEEGDTFTAADFNLTVTSLTSQNPYNGEATAVVPYLGFSTYDFELVDVWVNEDGQMYRGRVNMVGLTLSILDPEIADQITSYMDKINGGLDAASTYTELGNSIISGLANSANTPNTPIDWSQYTGWTSQELFTEGKEMVTNGSALIRQGTPESIAAGKQMMITGIELIKASATR